MCVFPFDRTDMFVAAVVVAVVVAVFVFFSLLVVLRFNFFYLRFVFCFLSPLFDPLPPFIFHFIF